jgi:phage-related protein
MSSGRFGFYTKFTDTVYILHCFQKKTAKINKTDIDLAEKRYRDPVKELAE